MLTSLPALAPGVYLLYAQWKANGNPIRRIPYVLPASVMGAVIMLIVVGAVVRVLFSKELAFERTPKFGIAQASDSWDGKRYFIPADWALLPELLCAAFSLATVTYAAALHVWGSLLYAMYFLVGLVFVIGTNVGQLSPTAVPRAFASVSGGRDL